MSKTMLVNVVNAEESRIAIVADGRLEELSIETAQHEQIEGNIYKARIVKVIASLDAVFVDYGRERNGFLAAPDIHPQYFRDNKREVDSLRKGDDLLVQVKKGEIGQKGAALTTYVSLPGRHFVLMPQVSKRGVSRKIEDEDTRNQLRKVLDDSGIPEEMGYIARTAAEGRTKQELTRDAGYLLRLWKTIRARYDEEKAPALLYEETDIVIRTLRDYFTPAIGEVLIDDAAIYEQVQSFFQAVMPWHTKRLRLHQGHSPLFSKYNLEDQIASIYEKSVPLPSGGSIVIEQTEALVSIDVNSGKTTSGKDIEETALIANKEAAAEVARQLRLRDMGGLIVIDFIDMRPAKNRSEVRKVLLKELKEDKARTDTSTIGKFGLLELSRQRIKGVARAGASQSCPVCSGLGRVRTPESSALSTLRRIQLRLPRKGAVRQVLIGVPAAVATLLQNRQRGQIMDLEARFGTEILIFAENSLVANQYYLEYRTKDRSEVETNLPETFNRARLLAPEGLPVLPLRPRRPALYAPPEEEPVTEAPVAEEEPPAAADHPPAQAVTTAPGEPPKEGTKKRRRRRRKSRGGEERPAGTEPPAGSTEPPAADEPVKAPPKPEEAAAAGPEAPLEPSEGGEAKPPSAAAKRRKRRRRSSGRTQTEAAAAIETPQEPPATAAATPPDTAMPSAGMDAPIPPAEEAAPVAPQRARRPRRRKPKSATATGDIPQAEVQESGTHAESTPPAAEAASAPPPAEAAPKPRRTRRKPAAKAQTEGAPSGEAPTAEPEAPAKRASRKRAKPVKPAAISGEAAEAASPPDTETKTAATEKPARKSRRKSASAPAATETAPPAAAAAGSEDSAK